MKKGIVVLIFVTALLIANALVSAQSTKGPGFSGENPTPANWYGKSVALVVGIDHYSNGWPTLSAAVSDANQMEATLRGQGFQVVKLLNQQATRDEIMRQLYDAIPPQVGSHDRFLFYFSGHGQTELAPGGQLGYLVPVNGKRQGGQDQFSSYISMKELKNILLDKYAARHVLVVADACFSGLLATRSPIKSRSVESALRGDGKLVLTAGSRGETAVDGLFTGVLVQGLSGKADVNHDDYVTFSELSLFVEQRVADRSAGRQHPVAQKWEGEGQMVFRCGDQGSGGDEEPTPPPPVPTTPIENESAYSGDMVLIPGGWFDIGCVPMDSTCGNDVKPRQKVFLNKFYMDKHEVTVGEYKACVQNGKCKEPSIETKGYSPQSFALKVCTYWMKEDQENHPMNCISWYEANTYCKAVGKRLPTEAEFEFALRNGHDGELWPWGNNSSPPKNKYENILDISMKDDSTAKNFWGDVVDDYFDGYPMTSPVCSFEVNTFGLCDIYGNVAEWCEDWYDENGYSKIQQKNPINSHIGSKPQKTIRGSCWLARTKISDRTYIEPNVDEGFEIGFRCAKDADGQAYSQYKSGELFTSQPANDVKIIGNSGRFQKTSCGSIVDPMTGLEWSPDSGSEFSLEQANSYLKNFHLCGYSDWRFPTRKEIVSVLEKNKRTPSFADPCNGVADDCVKYPIDPVFKLSGASVMTSETSSTGVTIFDFEVESLEFLHVEAQRQDYQVLFVRGQIK